MPLPEHCTSPVVTLCHRTATTLCHCFIVLIACTYSGQFALRSWLYILLHGLVALPATWLHGAAAGKVAVFVSTRAAMGLASAATETLLFRCFERSVCVHMCDWDLRNLLGSWKHT